METLHIYIKKYKEISFITILDVTTRRQSIAKPPMEDSYGRLHMNIDVCEIKQVVNILHIHQYFLYYCSCARHNKCTMSLRHDVLPCELSVLQWILFVQSRTLLYAWIMR